MFTHTSTRPAQLWIHGHVDLGGRGSLRQLVYLWADQRSENWEGQMANVFDGANDIFIDAGPTQVKRIAGWQSESGDFAFLVNVPSERRAIKYVERFIAQLFECYDSHKGTGTLPTAADSIL